MHALALYVQDWTQLRFLWFFCSATVFTRIVIFCNSPNFCNFHKIPRSRRVFLATNLSDIHLATNLMKIVIFHNIILVIYYCKIRSSHWALQQISVVKCNIMNIPRSFTVRLLKLWTHKICLECSLFSDQSHARSLNHQSTEMISFSHGDVKQLSSDQMSDAVTTWFAKSTFSYFCIILY